MYIVYIIGAGQIGSRHLQALRSVKLPLYIYVIDPKKNSLDIAKERYESFPGTQHKIQYLQKIPKNVEVDLSLVATCSDIRAGVVKQLLSLTSVKYLVLEKLLFGKRKDYGSIEKILGDRGIKTWVNCSMRMMPTYQKIEKYFQNKRISYMVTGSKFGLITNAVHYLDHAAHLTGTTEFLVNTAGLDPKPISSKRKGFLEFNGTLTTNFKNGSNISITCYPDGNAPVIVEVHSDNARYIGRESEERAWLARAENNWKWEELEAPIPLQSQLTTVLVEKILTTGSCDLTLFKQSKKIHLQMLDSLLYFLNNQGKKKLNKYPFT